MTDGSKVNNEIRCPHCGSIFTPKPQVELLPADDLGFSVWWSKCPRQIGKLAAQRVYRNVIMRQLATPEELLQGLLRYRRNKPDEQAYCHPTTWLNQGRWLDKEADEVNELDREARSRATASLPAPRQELSVRPAPPYLLEPLSAEERARRAAAAERIKTTIKRVP